MGIRIGIGNLRLGSGTRGGSIPFSKLLFWGKYSEIADGKMPNKLGSDWLTVSGIAGSETYICPDTLDYKNADDDELWSKWSYEIRTVTTAELIGYDFSRTIVKYLDDAPNTIEEIMIVKSGEVLSTSDINALHKAMRLSIFWSGSPNIYGYLKSNRGLSRSVFTPDANIILTDTYTKAWYKPNQSDGVLAVSGVESVYWDMMFGSNSLAATETSGSTIAWSVYTIVTTTADYFYTGCQVGDIFVASSAKLLSASNSVKKHTGNHLTQSDATRRPINGVFNGSKIMHTSNFTFNQPEFLYIVVKQLGWTSTKYLFDGGSVTNSGMAQQANSSPQFQVYAGTPSSRASDLAIGSIGIIRCYFNGASSKLIIDAHVPITGNFGAGNMGGFTLGGAAPGTSISGGSNIQFYEGILRTSDADESSIYNYLKTKYGIS
jgi:hypothetical protein